VEDETSTCAFSQNDPFEIEEVMESVEKNNGAPVIFSPSAERSAAKSRRPKVAIWKQFDALPTGSEWTGTACGHIGRKGIDFFKTNYSRCKQCVIQNNKELRAKQPPKSYPIVPTMAQEERLVVEAIVDRMRTEVQPKAQIPASKYYCEIHSLPHNGFENGAVKSAKCPSCVLDNTKQGMSAMRANQVTVSFNGGLQWLLGWLNNEAKAAGVKPSDYVVNMLLSAVPAEEMKALIIELRSAQCIIKDEALHGRYQQKRADSAVEELILESRK